MTSARRPFRDGLLVEQPLALLGSRCEACGAASFPARSFCPACRAAVDTDPVPLIPTGSVLTATVVRQAPEREVPYVLARVRLDDGPTVLAEVRASRVEDVAIDSLVHLVPAVFRGGAGEDCAGFAFALSEEAQA